MTQILHPEAGWNSTLELAGDTVIKTSPLAHVYGSLEEAEATANGLRTYADELSGEPLRTVRLLGVDVVAAKGGYKVKHTYDHVDGPSLNRLRPAELQPAMATLLGQVAGMQTIDGPNKLRTPFDAKAQNFHVDSDGPTLVDIFPAFSRLPDGSFPAHLFKGEPKRGGFTAWSLGTKAGAMSAILSTAIDRGPTSTKKLQHVLRTRDDWAYDVLPSDVDATVKDAVRRQVASHFVPFLARSAIRKGRARISGML